MVSNGNRHALHFITSHHIKHYRIRSKNLSPFVHQRICHLRPLELYRMKKNIGGDEHLDFSDETLKRR